MLEGEPDFDPDAEADVENETLAVAKTDAETLVESETDAELVDEPLPDGETLGVGAMLAVTDAVSVALAEMLGDTLHVPVRLEEM